ncbi:MAG: zinc-binding dehydrogenase [Candidatus Bathyarchaeota archaeon]|nr:MAG: zinc-binding dehydrogenase [Candidatus Bathyarchaeota archaeon]
MKSIVFEAPHRISVRNTSIPEIRDNDVLIRIESAAICNATDLHFLKGEIPEIEYPLPPGKPGHECSGEVVEVGNNVDKTHVGERVVPGPLYALPCGICPYCIAGKQELCEDPKEIDLAYSEYLAIPVRYCYRLPENVPYDEAALIDLLACAIHGMKRAEFSVGESVVIIGQGPAGLLLTQLSKLAGVDQLVACDIQESRLVMSRKLGADYTVNASKENLSERVSDLSGQKGFDVAIDAVGTPIVAAQAIKTIKPGGRLLVFGFHLKPACIDMAQVFSKELEIKASFRTVGELDYRLAIDLASSEKIDLKTLITHVMPLEQLQQALKLIDKGAEDVVKVILNP